MLPQSQAIGGSRLELRGADGNRKHYLQGRVVVAGDVVEVLLADGQWLRGEYQWNGRESSWPGLRVPLGGPWVERGYDNRPLAAVISVHPDACMRWPGG
jgi:hypothetical protein